MPGNREGAGVGWTDAERAAVRAVVGEAVIVDSHDYAVAVPLSDAQADAILDLLAAQRERLAEMVTEYAVDRFDDKRFDSVFDLAAAIRATPLLAPAAQEKSHG